MPHRKQPSCDRLDLKFFELHAVFEDETVVGGAAVSRPQCRRDIEARDRGVLEATLGKPGRIEFFEAQIAREIRRVLECLFADGCDKGRGEARDRGAFEGVRGDRLKFGEFERGLQLRGVLERGGTDRRNSGRGDEFERAVLEHVGADVRNLVQRD